MRVRKLVALDGDAYRVAREVTKGQLSPLISCLLISAEADWRVRLQANEGDRIHLFACRRCKEAKATMVEEEKELKRVFCKECFEKMQCEVQ